jgi:hypothetical protein
MKLTAGRESTDSRSANVHQDVFKVLTTMIVLAIEYSQFLKGLCSIEKFRYSSFLTWVIRFIGCRSSYGDRHPPVIVRIAES